MTGEASNDKTPTRRLIIKEDGRMPPSKMTRVSADDKIRICRKDKAPTKRLIKKEGGPRPPIKMTRVSQMTREASKEKARP